MIFYSKRTNERIHGDNETEVRKIKKICKQEEEKK